MIEDGAIHDWFGLTYANYLVLHRTVLQSMPGEWQDRFVELLREVDDACFRAGVSHPPEYRVQAVDERGRYMRDPVPHYNRGRTRIDALDPGLTRPVGTGATMPIYRKRRVTVEARQHTGEMDGDLELWLGEWFETWLPRTGQLAFRVVKNGGREAIVGPGDWIIRERDSVGFYPCTAAEFAALYEPVAPGACDDPACPVLHEDPANPIHPPA